MDLNIDWARFFAIPETASFWTILNSPILVAIIAAIIGWHLNRRINAAREDAEAAHEEAAIAIKVAESHDESLDFELDLPQSSGSDQTEAQDDYRDQLRELAGQAKAFIETQIAEDPDKRHQRTYARFNGHHPVSRAFALRERDRISAEQEHALVTILRTWNRYNKGRAANRTVPKSVYDLMQSNWQILK